MPLDRGGLAVVTGGVTGLRRRARERRVTRPEKRTKATPPKKRPCWRRVRDAASAGDRRLIGSGGGGGGGSEAIEAGVATEGAYSVGQRRGGSSA